MRALSIRQPYAEEILRGIKRIEYRSRPTRIIGERVYIYASTQPGDDDRFAALGCSVGELPVGVLVGTVVVSKCDRRNGTYRWHLADPKRLKQLRRPSKKPQPVWFNPF